MKFINTTEKRRSDEQRFSQQLVNLRRQNNWSQSELAEKLFVSRQAISKWEMGTSEPDIDKLIQLSQLFNSDLDFF